MRATHSARWWWTTSPISPRSRLAGRRGRGHRQGNVGPHVRVAGGGGGFGGRGGIAGQRGANYWESKDRSDRRIFVTPGASCRPSTRAPASLVDSFADHGKLDLKIGIDRGNRPTGLPNSRPHLREHHHSRQRNRRRISGASGRYSRFRRRHRQAAVGLPHHPASRRVRATTPGPRMPTSTWAAWTSWGEITVDEKRGIVYLPTASAKYELYGGDRPGDNLYADCLLALDARTGKYLWHYQTIHHDLWDYDPECRPATRHRETRWQDGRCRCARVEERLPLCVRPRHGQAAVADRGASRSADPTCRVKWHRKLSLSHRGAPVRRQGMTVKDMYTAFMSRRKRAGGKTGCRSARTGFYTPPASESTPSTFPASTAAHCSSVPAPTRPTEPSTSTRRTCRRSSSWCPPANRPPRMRAD